MQPTKLPDELFIDDEWLGADYSGRVALLLSRYHHAANESRTAWEKVSLALAERDTVRADAKDLRERNAALVSEIERMHREKMTTRHNEGAGT